MMFFCEMLGGASTCICHFFCLSVRLFIILFIHRSIRLSIAHCIVSFCKTCSLKVNSKDTRVICVIFSKFATKEVRWSSKVSRNSISGLTDYAQFFFFLIFFFIAWNTPETCLGSCQSSTLPYLIVGGLMLPLK